MDYKMSYDDVDDDVINQEDWTIFVQLGKDFLSQQVIYIYPNPIFTPIRFYPEAIFTPGRFLPERSL